MDALANTTQQKAAISSLFYIDNFLHDFFYDAGFNEAAGNAQFDNYGRGGIGGDTIRAEAQDSSGTNNANMSTPADGGRPRQQMYIWSGPQNETITVNSQPAGGTLPPSYNPFQIGTANFGPQVFDVTADVVRVDDGVGAVNDGCEVPFVTSVTGKIAFIDRGAPAASPSRRPTPPAREPWASSSRTSRTRPGTPGSRRTWGTRTLLARPAR